MTLKYLLPLWKLVYDHWLIFVSTAGGSLVIWLKNKIPEIANYQIPLWIIMTVVFLGLFCWYIYDNFLCDKKEIAPTKHEKPEKILQEFEPEIYMSVVWKAWIGASSNFSDRRIWVDGPFCPVCMYELDRYEKSWSCIHCDKKFKIQKNIREYTPQKIIKVFTIKAERVGGLKSKVFTTTQKGVFEPKVST